MKHIDVTTLNQVLMDTPDLTIIDVRSFDEYRANHIPQAKSVPLDFILGNTDDALEQIKALTLHQKTVYIVCLSDRRSFMACHKLAEHDFHHTCFLQGGTHAWIAAGYPVISEG